MLENDIGSQRASLYGFLAELFRAPPTAGSAGVLAEMADAMGIPCAKDVPLAQLQQEYADLFLVPNARYVAPYESVYRDRWTLDPGPGLGLENDADPLVMERLLMGESTLAVRQCFIEAQVLPAADLPDHIANELRLMSYLWEDEANRGCGDAGNAGELRDRMRRDHLRQWIGDLAAKVRENERLGFYSAALQLVEAALEDEETAGATV